MNSMDIKPHVARIKTLIETNPRKPNEYKKSILYQLFDITNPDVVDAPFIKQLKRCVLRIHPDKSQLPPEYFILAKYAYGVIKTNYENSQIEKSNVMEKYDALKNETILNVKIKPIIHIDENSPFTIDKFNSAFDEQTRYDREQTNQDRNDCLEWWRPQNNVSSYDNTDTIGNISYQPPIAAYVDPLEILNRQSTHQLVVHSGEITSCQADNGYHTAASSSTLPFADIRRVYHDKAWTDLDAISESNRARIQRDVMSSYNCLKNEFYTPLFDN